MTHLLDTSALLAHYLAEPGAERVQVLFEDDAVVAGASILSLYEFELRLHQMGLDHTRLTYRSQGRDYRLTDVHGEVVKGLLA